MLFRTFMPGPALSRFIDEFWLYEGYQASHPRERILPSGTFEMVFNLAEDELRIYAASGRGGYSRFSGAVISGPYAGPFVSDGAEEAAILGVHFKPGGAWPLLGPAAGDFSNLHVDLGVIWGPAAAVLRDRLCEVRQPIERFQLLERTLAQRLLEAPVHAGASAAADLLIRSRGRARVRDVALAVDLSPRRLAEVFTAHVGLPPKLFGRVQRFQHALALSAGVTRPDWAAIAVECGYFDQAHLIHEFNEFSGVTPADYCRRHAELERAGVRVKRNHLPFDPASLLSNPPGRRCS